MTEIAYNITPAVIDIDIQQGATYLQLWNIRYQTGLFPFPFFSGEGVLLWKARCMFRASYSDASPVISLTSEASEVLILLDNTVTPNLTNYGLSLTAAQTASLPSGRLLYDIEFERLSDGWVVKLQKGKVRIAAEVTK
jgi:hypothetical protein